MKNEIKETIRLLPILIVVLFSLKWIGVISWPWWLVLLPLWGSICFGICFGLFYTFLTILRDILKKHEEWKKIRDFKKLK
jgi:hypothetical protein